MNYWDSQLTDPSYNHPQERGEIHNGTCQDRWTTVKSSALKTTQTCDMVVDEYEPSVLSGMLPNSKREN